MQAGIGAINQGCRGIKIGGWGSGGMDESGAHNKNHCSQTPLQTSLTFFKTLNDLGKFCDQLTDHTLSNLIENVDQNKIS